MIQVSVELDPQGPSLTEKLPIDICNLVLSNEGVKDGEVNLIFGSDDLLSELKKTFFNLDQLTDVIAFRLNEYSEKTVEGEIYISLPRAIENAQDLDEDKNKEVARLIIHGSLHLLDYNDETEDEKAQMRNLEDRYLEMVNWKNLNVAG